MHSNQVEWSTAVGPYSMMHDVKVPFFIPEFSSSKITSHRFHIDNYDDKLGICYNMIIFHGLIVQLDL